MSEKVLWSPPATKNNIDKFIEYVNIKEEINSYEALHKWSVEKKEIFWGSKVLEKCFISTPDPFTNIALFDFLIIFNDSNKALSSGFWKNIL